MYERSYGAKYNKELNTTQIAKAFREDVKAAKKSGELPKNLKLSVTTDYYSMGSSISVKVKEWGGDIYTTAFLLAEKNDPHRYFEGERWTGQAKALLKQLKGMLDAYNHDGSDMMTDYYDVKFSGSVDFDWELEKADKEKQRAGVAPLPQPELRTNGGPAGAYRVKQEQAARAAEEENPMMRAF